MVYSRFGLGHAGGTGCHRGCPQLPGHGAVSRVKVALQLLPLQSGLRELESALHKKYLYHFSVES